MLNSSENKYLLYIVITIILIISLIIIKIDYESDNKVKIAGNYYTFYISDTYVEIINRKNKFVVGPRVVFHTQHGNYIFVITKNIDNLSYDKGPCKLHIIDYEKEKEFLDVGLNYYLNFLKKNNDEYIQIEKYYKESCKVIRN